MCPSHLFTRSESSCSALTEPNIDRCDDQWRIENFATGFVMVPAGSSGRGSGVKLLKYHCCKLLLRGWASALNPALSDNLAGFKAAASASRQRRETKCEKDVRIQERRERRGKVGG